MDISQLYDLYKESFKVDTDTRKIRKGALFFALKGENFNGNHYAMEALKKGASYAIIDDSKFDVDTRTILVNNALETLQELAKFHRKKLTIPFIGLTGSNGKTTSKELINAVLSKKYKTFATKGNLNNHIGVPLSILSITPEVEIGIIEMGANHQKEIEFLSNISLPDFGFITNFGKAHLEGFGGIEGVVKGKSELYQNIRENKKKVFVNAEDPKQMELTTDLDRVLFYPSEIEIIKENPFLKLRFQNIVFQTNLIGTYNALNISVALKIGDYFNLDREKSLEAISEYSPTNNRSQLVKKTNNTIYLDAYNANPSSMSLALKSFAKQPEDNKILILGDMFELGEESFKEHQEIDRLCVELGFNKVFLIGENFFRIKSKYQQFSSTKLMADYLEMNPIKNSIILMKGSRGMALEKLLDFID